MRMIDELVVRGEPDEIVKFLERIEWEQADPHGFELESVSVDTGAVEATTVETPNRERQPTPLALDGRPWWVESYFQTSDVEEAAPARIILRTSGFNELGVSILSRGPKSMSDEQYNALLDRFRRFLIARSGGLAVDVKLVPFRMKLERIVSYEAMQKLDAFVKATDKAEPGKLDRRRWSSFATQVHVDNSPLASEELDLWLKLEGWTEESRRILIDWFEATLSLLTEYDEARVG